MAMTWSGGALDPAAHCVLAPNPGPMTLDGTNTWILCAPGADRCVVVDPGPDDEAHLRAVLAVATGRGTRVAAILLTHGHLDHIASAAALCRAHSVPAFIHPDDDYMLDDPLTALSPELRRLLAGLPLDQLRPPEVLALTDLLEPGLAGIPITIEASLA